MRALFISVTVAFAVLFQPADAAPLSATEIKAAKKLYEVKCAKCHKFYEPTAYSQPEWDDWMVKMSRKSKLKAEQDRLLTDYLNDYRKNGKFAGQ